MFHNYVDSHKHDVFEGGAEVLMGRLSAAAENIGKALSESLRELAEKVRLFMLIFVVASFIFFCRLKCRFQSFGKAPETPLIKFALERKLFSPCARYTIS
jgi:hypothetical protein